MCLIWLPVFSYFFYNEPALGVGIDPGMALTLLPSSIGRRLNPRPSDREPSALPLDQGFRLPKIQLPIHELSAIDFLRKTIFQRFK